MTLLVWQELFHGYEPTIDPEHVRQTRASLVRMLQEFVTDTHAASDSALPLDEALRRAGEGSMESVTAAYEAQARRAA